MRRLAVAALPVLAVGLALHNLVMATLWQAGVRGIALDAVAAWKEAVLAAALAAGLASRRRLPLDTWADRLALAFAALVVLYALVPQGWLGGEASARGVLYGLRHDLLPVAAYFLGRLVEPTRAELRRLAGVVVATAAAVAAFGLVDVYAIPLQWWRDSGVPGWYREQLGLAYQGLSGLPENWVYNTGDESHPLRRLVSTFLSPLASSYLFVVALLAAAACRRWLVAVPLVGAGLLWTHSRSSILALAVGLGALALVRRRWWPVAAAAAVLALGVGFVKAFPHVGPETSYTPSELRWQRENARSQPGEAHDPLAAGESSIDSHWDSLRAGLETVARHPQGYGLGNAGVTAARTGLRPKAGESTYTELGVDAGLAGALLFLAWSAALVARVRSAWVVASLAAVLALGVQTDVIGVPWLAYVLWALAGAAASPERGTTPAR